MTEKLFNPQYLQSLCKNYNLVPTKKYGQNYLISKEVIDKIITASKITKKDIVVEIGAGFGVLTLSLVQKAKQVLSFEIEKKLQSYWQKKPKENLQIIWGNVLNQLNYLPKENYKLVANLPYQITALIIKTFLELKHPPKQMTLMVQKEVAERICAPVGEKSVLALTVEYYANPKIIEIISKKNFWPIPKVDSAILFLEIKEKKDNFAETKKLFQLIKIGFSNKRKKLIKNLTPFLNKENKQDFLNLLKSFGFNENVRAQELSLNHWQKIKEFL